MILILLSTVLNLFIILNYLKISHILKLYDYPDKKRKIHLKKVPLLGGIIIYLNFLLLFFYTIFYPGFFEENLKTFFLTKLNFLNLFIISSLVFLLGIYDDKKNLNANLKLVALIILTYFLLKSDENVIIENIKFVTINFDLNLHSFSIFLTILCFVLFINASNMYDGIDLQIGPYFIFIFLIFIFKLKLLLFSVTFLIPLLVFCYLNFNGKIFIGNSGAYFVSFIIAFIFVKQNNLYSIISTEEIFLAMSIPGLDMFRLFIYRILKKRNPFSADKKHLHHYLLSNFNIRISQIYIFVLNISPFCFYQLFKSINVIFITIIIYILIYFLLLKKTENDY